MIVSRKTQPVVGSVASIALCSLLSSAAIANHKEENVLTMPPMGPVGKLSGEYPISASATDSKDEHKGVHTDHFAEPRHVVNFSGSKIFNSAPKIAKLMENKCGYSFKLHSVTAGLSYINGYSISIFDQDVSLADVNGMRVGGAINFLLSTCNSTNSHYSGKQYIIGFGGAMIGNTSNPSTTFEIEGHGMEFLAGNENKLYGQIFGYVRSPYIPQVFGFMAAGINATTTGTASAYATVGGEVQKGKRAFEYDITGRVDYLGKDYFGGEVDFSPRGLFNFGSVWIGPMGTVAAGFHADGRTDYTVNLLVGLNMKIHRTFFDLQGGLNAIGSTVFSPRVNPTFISNLTINF